MLQTIENYVNSLNDATRANHLRLVIENGTLVTKKQSEINCWTRFTAWMGCGRASFKNVCLYIKNNRDDDLFKDPQWNDRKDIYEKFKLKVCEYNQKHVSWKKIKRFDFEEPSEAESVSGGQTSVEGHQIEKLEQLDFFPGAEYTPVGLAKVCNELRDKYTKKTDWSEDDVNDLMPELEKLLTLLELDKQIHEDLANKLISAKGKKNRYTLSHELKMAIKLETMSKSLGKNEEFINALLMLRMAVNKALVKDETVIADKNLRTQLKKNLKNLQETALKSFFERKLGLQYHKLVHYQEYYRAEYQEIYKQPSSRFIETEFAHWEEKLKKGKPIAFPKWFHCSPSENIVPILNSEILVQQVKMYKGAFASTTLEMGHIAGKTEAYGNWGFALSDHIETAATTHPNGAKEWPLHSVFNGTPVYGEQYVMQDNGGKPIRNINYDPILKFWAGFQRSIPMAQVSKYEHPLEYFNDTTLCYLVYKKMPPLTDDRHLLLKTAAPVAHGQPGTPAEVVKILTLKKIDKHTVPNPTVLKNPLTKKYDSFKVIDNVKNCPELAQPQYLARKVRIVSCQQIEEICKLFKTSGDTFCFPKEWEGKFEKVI